MTAVWWVLGAFFGGGLAGVLLMAMMYMSGEASEQSDQVPEFNSEA